MKDKEKNQFTALNPEHDVPEEIKTKLMKNITLLELLHDITDLFSDKIGKTAMDLLKRNKP